MKKLILIASVLSASVGQAEIYRCTFTEPFVNSQYDPADSTLTYRSAEGKVVVFDGVSLEEAADGKIVLTSAEKGVLQTLELTFKASDGMSDRVYPFEVTDTSGLASVKSKNTAIGGCASKEHKSYNPNN